MKNGNPENTLLLFSHGFGIRKDNLGLFTFLAKEFESLGFSTIQFDYYQYNEATKEVFTIPFSKQAQILQEQINKIRNEFPNKNIVIIAQSQGCLIPTLCDVTNVVKVIAISPFFVTDREAVFAKYNARAGSTTNFNDISKRKHSDGTTTVIPPEYWAERFKTNQYELYSSLGQKTALTIIYGLNDPHAESVEIDKIQNAKLISTNADHDFTGENRTELYRILQDEIIKI